VSKNSRSKLSQNVISHWPEVFKDIEIHTVPLQYLQAVTVHFDNGKIWVIEITDKIKANPDGDYGLEAMFREYEDSIINIDFRVDVKKVRKDIEKRTKQFLKKRK
tara:strand:+ start:7705 stop:8019 length:315 start_codon:yes stop_codon:yes gene_type:complete